MILLQKITPRGVLVEEMVDHEGELRVLVLHGKVEVTASFLKI